MPSFTKSVSFKSKSAFISFFSKMIDIESDFRVPVADELNEYWEGEGDYYIQLSRSFDRMGDIDVMIIHKIKPIDSDELIDFLSVYMKELNRTGEILERSKYNRKEKDSSKHYKLEHSEVQEALEINQNLVKNLLPSLGYSIY